ncbi:hypothetical protein B0H13DRAFT_1877519 [Mycena leptocephala]|nr:hypothetical protein B0H13DRAFT_1877519 [Mycena leptocephala]
MPSQFAISDGKKRRFSVSPWAIYRHPKALESRLYISVLQILCFWFLNAPVENQLPPFRNEVLVTARMYSSTRETNISVVRVRGEADVGMLAQIAFADRYCSTSHLCCSRWHFISHFLGSNARKSVSDGKRTPSGSVSLGSGTFTVGAIARRARRNWTEARAAVDTSSPSQLSEMRRST